MSNIISLTASGYTCGTCGAWVPYGQEHYCGGTVPVTSNYPCCACFSQLQQLLEKIGKFLDLLEKRERRETTKK